MALPSPEKIHSNVQVLFQNHRKPGFLQGEVGDRMTPRGPFPSCASSTLISLLRQHYPHFPDQEAEAQRGQELAVY